MRLRRVRLRIRIGVNKVGIGGVFGVREGRCAEWGKIDAVRRSGGANGDGAKYVFVDALYVAHF